jgi:membrane protease YdiL (CAAX protease family)
MVSKKERDALLVASTIVILMVVSMIWDYDFINQQMWLALDGGQVFQYSALGLTLLAATALASKLAHEHEIMHFSLLRYIKPLRWVANLVLIPLKLWSPLVVLYIIVLTYTLPALTFFEEYIFRGKIEGWVSAIVVTVVFALSHMLMGATLGVATALVVPGAIFALFYQYHGLVGATYLHTFYDVGAIMLAVGLFLRERNSHKADLASAVE